MVTSSGSLMVSDEWRTGAGGGGALRFSLGDVSRCGACSASTDAGSRAGVGGDPADAAAATAGDVWKRRRSTSFTCADYSLRYSTVFL